MKNQQLYKRYNKERGLLNDSYQNKSRRFVEKIITSVMKLFSSDVLPPYNEQEQILIDDLRKQAANFVFISQGSKAEDEWMKHANRVTKLIEVDDPRRFLTWNPIKDTMGGSNYFFVIPELRYLKSNIDWNNKWKNILIEDKIGSPEPFFLYPKSSGNLIHHAYVLANFEDKTCKQLSDMNFIFEFGGGYGSVCRLIHKNRFKGKYLMYDISVFTQLQIFFLKSIGLPVYSFNDFLRVDNGICCVSDLEQVKLYFSQNRINDNSLFIAMWSLSESSIRTRESLLGFFKLFNNYIFGFQDKFGEINNIDFFKSIKRVNDNVNWNAFTLSHLPRHNLLFGTK